MQIYQVGGSVRDKFINPEIESHDIDYVVVGSTIEEMLSLGFIQVGKSFPVFLHPETKQEYALARKEVKTGDKHTDFEFDFNPNITLKEDLERRDFTMNAIALAEDGTVIDPFDGKSAIKQKLIIHVNAKHFIEDPLRVLRACRFAAQLNFDIHPSTMELLQDMVKQGMLQHLSRTRIDNEFIRAFSPGYDSSKFILMMYVSGALKELYPEINDLFDNEENKKYHSTGNTGYHVLCALNYAKDMDMHIKLGVLYHDIYKPIAYHVTRELKKVNPNAYQAHDGDEALRYFTEISNHREFSYKIKQSIKTAIKYHMKMWTLFEGMAIKNFVDLLAEITRDFDESYEYLLIDLLKVCASDDNSDKTEECINIGQTQERCELLKKISMDVFDICSKIKFKDIPNYKELDPLKVKEKQRILRIEAVKQYFKDNNYNFKKEQ